jgi:hypothetical protein
MSTALEKEYHDGDPRLTETEVRKRLASYNAIRLLLMNSIRSELEW